MFWRVSTYSQQTPADAILDKGHVILEDLLEVEDLAKETKAVNGRLVACLKKPDNLRKLVLYVIGQPPTKPGEAARESDVRTRHSLAACEALCSLAEELPDLIGDNESLLRTLFTATETGMADDCALAGYFSKLLGILLSRSAEQILKYLKAHREVLNAFLPHLDTAGMAESFVRLVGADEQITLNAQPEALAWIADTDILTRLLERLDEDAAAGKHGNCAEVLAAIARSRSSPLTSQLCEPERLEGLMKRAIVPPPDTPSVQALNIYIALLERRRLLASAQRQNSLGSPGPASSTVDADLEKVIRAIVPHVPMLATVLSTSSPSAVLETSYGVLRPPLGSVRLTIIELVAVLLRTGSEEAEGAIIESSAVQEVLQVFLRFPFNSILHHQVTSIVACMLETGSDAIVEHLFGDCDLLGWLLNAPAQFEPERRGGDERERAPLRAGYMGHLTEIANSLQAVAARRPAVARTLCSNAAWTDFAFGPLAERNQLEDVLSWQCGHPQVRSMQSTSASKEASEASGDLQLDVLSNLERHVDRLSAFSDEEDEAELHNLYMDANGDSDLWDLAITEAGEAVRNPSSTSPFASKALLTCFNSDEEDGGPWWPQPSTRRGQRGNSALVADTGSPTGGDERDRQLASSPPPSWEDRAELMPEEQPFGVSWMETDEGGERSGGQESPPAQNVISSPPASSSTPDLLADTPPQQQPPPDDDRLDLASSRPQRLLRGRSSPRSSPGGSSLGSPEPSPPPSGLLPRNVPAPSAAAPSSTAGAPAQQAERSVPGAGAGQGPPGEPAVATPANAAASTAEPALPRGCYATLAAHDRGPKEGSLGHELPSCFGASDPNMRRSSSPPRAAAQNTSSQGSSAGSSTPGMDRRSSREASPEAPARAASPAKEAEKGRGSGQPLSGLRDLLAPVGGLFKGAFGVPSNDSAAPESSPNAKPGGGQHDNGSSSPEDKPREGESQGMLGQPGSSPPQLADWDTEENMEELSEEPFVSSPELRDQPGDNPEVLAGTSAASVQQPGVAEGGTSDMTDEDQASVEERSQQARQDLMDVFSSQHTGSAQPAVHSSSFAASMQPQQGSGAQDAKAPAEGAPGPAAETPLAPYVPLMATDAVADAAAALLLDDVVPVQEENVVVVESISSNAGMPVAELVEGEEEEEDDSDRDSVSTYRTSSGESLGAMEAVAEAEHAAAQGTDALGMPLLAGDAEDSGPIGDALGGIKLNHNPFSAIKQPPADPTAERETDMAQLPSQPQAASGPATELTQDPDVDMLDTENQPDRSTVEGRIAAKLEPDTPATFGDSAGVALKDDEDTGELPWESTLPAMGQHFIVDEVMSDVIDEHAQRAEGGQPGQAGADTPDQPASQPSLLPSGRLRSLPGADASSKPGAPAKPSLSADASSAATHGIPNGWNPKTKDESEEDTLVGSFTKLGVSRSGPGEGNGARKPGRGQQHGRPWQSSFSAAGSKTPSNAP